MNDILNQVLMSLVGVFLTIAIPTVIGFLLEQISKIKLRGQMDKLDAALFQLHDTTSMVVSSLKTTMADEFKKISADGKLTKEEQLKIKSRALTTILHLLAPAAKEILKAAITDLTEYVSYLIEDKLSFLKKH